MDRERQLRIALAVNAVILGLVGLLVLWVHGPIIMGFQSIYRGMNIELPAIIQLYLSLASLICDIPGMLVAFAIFPATAFLVHFTGRKDVDPTMALSVLSSAQVLAFALMFFTLTAATLPMFKICNVVQ